MNIEKCSITTTETRTREMWISSLGTVSDKIKDIGLTVWQNPMDTGHAPAIPVTLTYPAPVQVDGVRVEMTVDEFRALCMVDLRNSGNAKELVLKMREFSIPDADQPSPISTFGVEDAFEKVREAVGDKLDGVDPLAKAEQDPRAAELQRAVARLAATLPKAKVGPPFNEPASDGTVYGTKPASPPTQPSGESTIGDRLIAGLEGFRDKLKSGEPIEAVTYTTPPAPKDAGKRGDEAEMRRRGWEWDSQLRGWTKAIREHKYILWYDHADSTWNANEGIEHIDSYPTQLAAVDACETHTPESTQPPTLPWHDLGPGLSVAVVEGRCYIALAMYSQMFTAGLWDGRGNWTQLDGDRDHPTLAAAKAACDAHHAKGGA